MGFVGVASTVVLCIYSRAMFVQPRKSPAAAEAARCGHCGGGVDLGEEIAADSFNIHRPLLSLSEGLEWRSRVSAESPESG